MSCFFEPIPFLFIVCGLVLWNVVFFLTNPKLSIQHWTYPLVLTVGQNPPKPLKTETLGIRLVFPSQKVCFFFCSDFFYSSTSNKNRPVTFFTGDAAFKQRVARPAGGDFTRLNEESGARKGKIGT